MKHTKRIVSLITAFILCRYGGFEGRAVSSIAGNVTTKTIKARKTKAKNPPKSILAPMAQRIDKKVHRSYKLQAMSPQNQYLQNIFLKYAKLSSRINQAFYTPPFYIAVTYDEGFISFVELKRVEKMPYSFIGYYHVNNCTFLIDKPMRLLMNPPKGEKKSIEFDHIIYYYTKETYPIDDAGWPIDYYLDKDSI